ncbi:MAG: glycosyltransferase family 4 protein [Terriglobia bacterium]|jgi:glycosyltransferase involved in cell wall biosynthesis|nr:glycosyltransferase family 4 protein [Terriglobia bacterium]
MHVLVTADTVGGVWSYAKELVTGLVRRGVRVTLVSFGNIPPPAQADWIEPLRLVDFRPTAFRLEWMQEAEGDVEASRDFLMSIIEETRPDVLHLNQYCYGNLPVSIPKIVVAHSDVVSWWATVKNEEPEDFEWIRWYRRAVSEGLAGATAVIAPSNWMLRQIYTWYSPMKRGRVIYNGRTPTLFNPHISKDDYILSVGRLWDGGKQAVLLTRIAPPSPVFIVGAEEHADAALRGVSAVGNAPAAVRLKGSQSEGQLRHWFGRAALYAATSVYEPFGLAPLEAAFSRCAIVANDIPSFREIWGETVCYFRTNDPVSLQRQLERLQGNRELRLRYANLAYNRARARYTADRMVNDYLDLYRTLAGVEAHAA